MRKESWGERMRMVTWGSQVRRGGLKGSATRKRGKRGSRLKSWDLRYRSPNALVTCKRMRTVRWDCMYSAVYRKHGKWGSQVKSWDSNLKVQVPSALATCPAANASACTQ